MVKSELIENGNRIHHWSDADMKLRQVETGNIYDDAVDVMPCRYTYEETDIPIEETEATAEEVLDILLGGDGE